MAVHDNPSKPFAHCLPLRLQGEHFTMLLYLALENLDWTAKPLFFRNISHLSSVVKLTLERCRFHRADDLWNLLSALTGLEELTINSVTVELDLFGRHTIPPSKHELCQLRLAEGYCVREDLPLLPRSIIDRTPLLPRSIIDRTPLLPRSIIDRTYCVREDLPLLPRSIIDVLSLLSRKVTHADIGLDSFRTFDDLICALPALGIAWEFPTPATDTRTAKTWTAIRLGLLSGFSHRSHHGGSACPYVAPPLRAIHSLALC
ncbi:hypothetical protein C8Q72DRAFT_414594 [Fomitopsis betulina]|nr:hypothetical protein C8Q72DRAFT_414594 [Fomitopsis betulina]